MERQEQPTNAIVFYTSCPQGVERAEVGAGQGTPQDEAQALPQIHSLYYCYVFCIKREIVSRHCAEPRAPRIEGVV
jgi:hypothetical protein